MSDIPISDRIKPRPVVQWHTLRSLGKPMPLPTDDVVRDAIAILKEGPEDPDNPAHDWLYAEAERILVRDMEVWS